MSEQNQQISPPDDQGPLSPTGVKALKFAVVAMGIMIVVGVGVVIGRIIYLASQSPDARTSSAAAITRPITLRATGKIVLPNGARATQVSIAERNLIVLYEGDQGSGVVIFDVENGRQLSHLTFSNGSGGAVSPSTTQTK